MRNHITSPPNRTNLLTATASAGIPFFERVNVVNKEEVRQ